MLVTAHYKKSKILLLLLLLTGIGKVSSAQVWTLEQEVNLAGHSTLLRNTAASGSIDTSSFAAKIDFGTGTNTHPLSVEIGDLDGDGLPEIVMSNQASIPSLYKLPSQQDFTLFQ